MYCKLIYKKTGWDQLRLVPTVLRLKLVKTGCWTVVNRWGPVLIGSVSVPAYFECAVTCSGSGLPKKGKKTGPDRTSKHYLRYSACLSKAVVMMGEKPESFVSWIDTGFTNRMGWLVTSSIGHQGCQRGPFLTQSLPPPSPSMPLYCLRSFFPRSRRHRQRARQFILRALRECRGGILAHIGEPHLYHWVIW